VFHRKSFGYLCSSVLVLLALTSNDARAQGQGQGGGALAQGVYVDAEGVLRTVMLGESGDRLNRLRRKDVRQASAELSGRSALRKISLAQVAKEVQACVRAGKQIPDDLKFLGGMTQIQYLFVYPEERDLVIAGPAEGWELDAAGRVVGQSSKRPVLRLEDLVIALRAFPPEGKPNPVVGCTINQTAEGVRNLNQFLASLGASVDARQINASLVQRVRDSMGLQDVEIWGVPSDSRLAAVLVEADYRMKLIGIGLENARVRGLTTYYTLLGPGDGGMNKLQRWWFVPDYEAIVESQDGNAFEFRGQRAKLVGADDKLSATGEVNRGDSAGGATKRFAQSFSSHFQELAKVNPIYADMQNAFDWIIVAALIQQRNLIRQVAPDIAYFLQSDAGYQPELLPVPKQAESVVNAKWIGRKLAIPVGGGVVVEPSKLLDSPSMRSRDATLGDRRRAARSGGRPDRWHWE
jgi:hypothetical protein